MADLPSNAHARRRPNVERDLFTLHVRYGDFTGTTTAENFSLRPDGTSTRNITFTHEEIAREALPTRFTFAKLRDTLLRTDGFETTTVEQLLTHRPAFVAYWHDVRTYLTSVGANVPTFAQHQTPRTKTGDLVGKVYCFTGFRDAALRSQLEARGAVVEDSLTKSVNVVVRKDASVESSTVKKARARGVAVVERGVTS